MVLKLFTKANGEPDGSREQPDATQRMERMEGHLRDLGVEVLRLRQEVNTMLTRQQTFKVALGRLREYLEQKGALEEATQEIQVPFQELLHEHKAEQDENPVNKAQSRKNKSGLH